MIYRRLDENGDRIFGGNSNDFLDKSDAIKQAVTTRLKLLKSEWWEDKTKGLPFFQQMVGSKNLELVKQLIVTEIQNVEGVKNVSDVRIELNENNNNTVIFSCIIFTNYTTEKIYLNL